MKLRTELRFERNKSGRRLLVGENRKPFISKVVERTGSKPEFEDKDSMYFSIFMLLEKSDDVWLLHLIREFQLSLQYVKTQFLEDLLAIKIGDRNNLKRSNYLCYKFDDKVYLINTLLGPRHPIRGTNGVLRAPRKLIISVLEDNEEHRRESISVFNFSKDTDISVYPLIYEKAFQELWE